MKNKKPKSTKKISSKKPAKNITPPFVSPLTRALEKAGAKFSVFEHKTVYTAFDAAQTTRKKLSEIAKAVLVKAKGVQTEGQSKLSDIFALAILPAGKYVDFGGIKKVLKAKSVSMASEKDITKYLKTKVGLLHPFGNLYGLPTLLDKTLARAKKMAASAGSYTHSVEISPNEFTKFTRALAGNFSKAKKS